jgi:hypothetical protein
LFEKAYCSFRIYVRVYQSISKPKFHCVSEFKNLISRKYKSLSSYICVRSVYKQNPSNFDYSNCRHIIETELFRNEKYLLVVGSRTTFTQNWDKHCVKQLKRCLRESKNPILTSFLPKANNYISKFDVTPTFITVKNWTPNYLTPKLSTKRMLSLCARPQKSLF